MKKLMIATAVLLSANAFAAKLTDKAPPAQTPHMEIPNLQTTDAGNYISHTREDNLKLQYTAEHPADTPRGKISDDY